MRSRRIRSLGSFAPLAVLQAAQNGSSFRGFFAPVGARAGQCPAPIFMICIKKAARGRLLPDSLAVEDGFHQLISIVAQGQQEKGRILPKQV